MKGPRRDRVAPERGRGTVMLAHNSLLAEDMRLTCCSSPSNSDQCSGPQSSRYSRTYWLTRWLDQQRGFPPGARYLEKSFSMFFDFRASGPTNTFSGVLMTLGGCLHPTLPSSCRREHDRTLSHRRLASESLPMMKLSLSLIRFELGPFLRAISEIQSQQAAGLRQGVKLGLLSGDAYSDEPRRVWRDWGPHVNQRRVQAHYSLRPFVARHG
jgi:hypothetical protein